MHVKCAELTSSKRDKCYTIPAAAWDGKQACKRKPWAIMGYLQRSFDAWGHQLGLGHCGTLLFPMYISQFSLRENNKILLSVLKCSSHNLRSNVSETASTSKKEIEYS